MSNPTAVTRRRLSLGGSTSALRVRFLGVVIFLAILVIAFSLLSPQFFTLGNGRSVLFTAAILAIAAAGQSLVVLTGNLDLSVGSIMGLTAYVVFDLAGKNATLQPFVVILALAIGALLGFINGMFVTVLQIPSIVATLGTLSIYRGFVSVYANAKEVTSGTLPPWMRALATQVWLGLPSYVWISAVIIAIVAVALTRLPWGRKIYAYGSNPKAARFYGLSSTHIVIGAYVGAGMIAAIAGLLLGAQVGNINSLLANGIELQVLAAVVIGGVSIWGGSGSVIGAAIGAVVLATINNGLVLLEVQEFYRLLIQGAAIIAAVWVDAIVQRRVIGSGTRRRIMEVES